MCNLNNFKYNFKEERQAEIEVMRKWREIYSSESLEKKIIELNEIAFTEDRT